MKTGGLDQRITLQSQSTANVGGEVTKSYTTQATVWGLVISQKGDESFESARMNSRQIIKVKIRYRSDVETTWRVQWMGQSYSVLSVDRSLRRDGELWLMCEGLEME